MASLSGLSIKDHVRWSSSLMAWSFARYRGSKSQSGGICRPNEDVMSVRLTEAHLTDPRVMQTDKLVQ